MNNNQYTIPTIIDIDEIKKYIPGYTPEKAAEFHTQSAKIADKIFEMGLKERTNRNILLMCGGSASGKSEFLAKFLPEDFEGLVYDSTLSHTEGAQIKIKKIFKSKNTPILCLILPSRLKDSFTAFCNRERKIPEYKFYETHSGARENTLWIAENYPDIEILIYENQYDPEDTEEENLSYSQKIFSSRDELLEFLQSIQYTKEEIYGFIQ